MTDCSDWESARGLRGAFVVFQTRLDVTIMASDPRIINYFILFEFSKMFSNKNSNDNIQTVHCEKNIKT